MMPDIQNQQEALQKIEAALEQLLVGKASVSIARIPEDPRLDRIVELTNMLSGNFAEMAAFARALATGSLDIDPPGRRNYLAAPLKELHSQLSSFVWVAQQLEKGRAVERMDFMGELSDAMNGLIEKVSALSKGIVRDQPDDAVVDSWIYQQILAAFNHMPQMVLLVDAERNIMVANQPAVRQLGEHNRLADQEDERPFTALDKLLCAHSCEENTFPVYSEVFEETGNAWYKVTSDQLQLPRGVRAYLHCIEDISEWKINETELKISATIDPLTGVYNRGLGVKTLETAIIARGRLTTCAAFVDIDGLKQINDNYGHNEGDYAIKTIAGMLASSVRDSDTVSRFGGDEFLVIFSGCRIEVAERVIGRVCEKLNIINESHIKPYRLAFSYGVTQIDETTDITVKDLIQLMDKKMYERKKNKKMIY